MCGIAGWYGDYDVGLLDPMVAALAHRGPDEEGTYVDDAVAMGARRLSIIDLAAGAQPMTNEDGSVHVTFNGEIYNHAALRQDLEAAGHRFETLCDTEVLVHLWEEYGTDMPTHLDGMFAFAIRDTDDDVVFLARDRLGIKPLFYAETADGFRWASEIRPLLLSGVERSVDERAVFDYFSLKYTPSPRTLFDNIRTLESGCSILLGPDGPTRESYWDLSPARVAGSRDTVSERVRELLEASIERRMMADVPVGAFLSGGLDSSAVVGLMARHLPDLKTFSVGFHHAEYDERHQAALVADHFGTDHTAIDVDLTSMDVFEEVVTYFGQPLADTTILPSYLLSQRASEDVKVVHSGAGADELFAGYNQYWRVPSQREQYGGYPGVAYAIADRLARLLPRGSTPADYAAEFAAMESDERAYLRSWTSGQIPTETFLDTDCALADLLSTVAESFAVANSDDAARRIAAFEIRKYLPDDLLYKLDHTSMAASLEARVPFLDHRLVEYAYGIPTGYKTGGDYKPVLRRAVADLLPEQTQERSKQQFAVPVSEWFADDVPTIEKWLSADRIGPVPYLPATSVFDAWDEHRAGRSDHTSLLWRSLNYVIWYHTFVEGEPPAPGQPN